jgi:hypothetical protein
MSNFFEEVLDNAKNVEEEILGPQYPYWNNINSPSQIGMSNQGSISALAKNVDGLINYVKLLVEGTGSASKTGQPLGNKFFLKTAAKCTAKDTGDSVDRYVYIDNVPDGSIPFISSAMGTNFSEIRGLVPGTMNNLEGLNPMLMFQAFMSGSSPDCQQLTMQTIDSDNVKGEERHYVTTVDIQNINSCTFPNKTNPISGTKCKESMANMVDKSKLPKDPLVQLFFASVGVVGVYMIYEILNKNKKIK